MYCSKCGNTLPDGSVICGYCGVVVAEDQESREDLSQFPQAEERPEPQTFLEADVPVLTQEQIDSLPAYSAKVEEMVDLCNAAANHLKECTAEASAVEEEKPVEASQQPEQEPEQEIVPNQESLPAALPASRRMGGTDKRARPMRTAGFFGTQFLLLIPVINIILLFVWAFRRRSNFNRKAYARSILIWILIALLLLLAGLLAMIILRVPIDINDWIDRLKAAVNSIPYV